MEDYPCPVPLNYYKWLTLLTFHGHELNRGYCEFVQDCVISIVVPCHGYDDDGDDDNCQA